jgi:hypothetical protein
MPFSVVRDREEQNIEDKDASPRRMVFVRSRVVIDSKTIDRMEMGNKTEGIRHVAERETIK